uniref:Uncharacterized protein n=1 Tax=Cannabis sativa TaxID=3483 RepID=A0A803NJ43_CANSA
MTWSDPGLCLDPELKKYPRFGLGAKLEVHLESHLGLELKGLQVFPGGGLEATSLTDCPAIFLVLCIAARAIKAFLPLAG